MNPHHRTPVGTEDDFEHTLQSIERRVLWLATSMIHHANHRRTTRSALKVGGHQASSASLTSAMTALYFASLRPEDRVAVKPHAGPVLHAINYLLGRLDEAYLTELRSFRGLQSYPSRTKDPDPIDFSTGSVGIGATATIWSALSSRYVADHFDDRRTGRHIALLGDAELDEGAIWEAVLDPMVGQLGELLWIVDVNRQSLDRVVPDFTAHRLQRMFEAAGWHTIVLKYGRRLRALYDLEGGDALKARIDEMSNGEFQRMLRAPAEDLRHRLIDDGKSRPGLSALLDQLGDADIASALRDLGGHDLLDLCEAIRIADATPDRPTVILAYTIKAWSLPTQGHPGNHSALLTAEQWEALAVGLGADATDPWKRFEPGSPEEALCEIARQRTERTAVTAERGPTVPPAVGRPQPPSCSTQQALGRLLVDLAHLHPDVADRIVTVSPDVAASTNLGAWINRVGVWSMRERFDWFSDSGDITVRWREGSTGQHIELGIAEGNLVGLLGELGTVRSRVGQPLIPIGTIYDPFITRALEPWSFGIYSGGRSILVGTPSGVTLAPEGGAHQSVVTPSIGLEQPQCTSWEPCFGQDLEWTMLHAMTHLDGADGGSAYFRLSTRQIDQALADIPAGATARELRRQHVIAGGYIIRRAPCPPDVALVGQGAIMPEVLAAAQVLSERGIEADVVCLTSADLLFRAMQARNGLTPARFDILDELFPQARSAPLVTVIDGHPHTLTFLAAVRGVRATSLGVSNFGQSGDLEDLYAHFGIDTMTIVGAAWDLLDGPI